MKHKPATKSLLKKQINQKGETRHLNNAVEPTNLSTFFTWKIIVCQDVSHINGYG